MEWLNYHHLRYFWAVAKAGSLARAAAQLHVSQPSISEQVRELEEALGEKLFRREGRNNRLTDTGRIVADYAEEIFALGQELTSVVRHTPGARAVRFHVGLADSLPKLVTNEILKPVFDLPQVVHVTCREGKIDDLLVQLAAHRLDVALAEEPASTGTNFKTFTHFLGESGTAFCAHPALAKRLTRGFPATLNGAPALLPAENTVLRRELEKWFRAHAIRPRVLADFEDLALMKVMAAEGRGFIVVPEIALSEAVRCYGFQSVGLAPDCRLRFYAITADRRIHHPATHAITKNARALMQR